MQLRYIIILNPFFSIVPTFSSRNKAVIFCAGMRQHLINIYPTNLGYKKVGNISTSPTHSIQDKNGLIVYSAEICKQGLNISTGLWVNLD